MRPLRGGTFRDQPADVWMANRTWHAPSFRALAHHRLGQTDHARAFLSRLRETMKSPTWARGADAQGWLREAEAIDLDVVFPVDPFAPGP
jgi:hypothetical protein